MTLIQNTGRDTRGKASQINIIRLDKDVQIEDIQARKHIKKLTKKMIDKVNEYRVKSVRAEKEKYIHEFDQKIIAKAQSLVDKHYKGNKFCNTADQQTCKIEDAMNREMNAEFTATMTKKEKDEWTARKAAMSKDVQKKYDDLEEDICNFHYIRYIPASVDKNIKNEIKMATFETRVKMRSKEEDIIRGINPRWVGFWMTVIFYELVKNFHCNGFMFQVGMHLIKLH